MPVWIMDSRTHKLDNGWRCVVYSFCSVLVCHLLNTHILYIVRNICALAFHQSQNTDVTWIYWECSLLHVSLIPEAPFRNAGIHLEITRRVGWLSCNKGDPPHSGAVVSQREHNADSAKNGCWNAYCSMVFGLHHSSDNDDPSSCCRTHCHRFSPYDSWTVGVHFQLTICNCRMWNVCVCTRCLHGVSSIEPAAAMAGRWLNGRQILWPICIWISSNMSYMNSASLFYVWCTAAMRSLYYSTNINSRALGDAATVRCSCICSNIERADILKLSITWNEDRLCVHDYRLYFWMVGYRSYHGFTLVGTRAGWSLTQQ